uniref:Uncharacterized protein n=1 Tax=Oryctolagus cuniculus TaxID=9986 RepID=A0A5F9C466_RABIT
VSYFTSWKLSCIQKTRYRTHFSCDLSVRDVRRCFPLSALVSVLKCMVPGLSVYSSLSSGVSGNLPCFN